MIYRALLKYSHSNFSLDILEYCELDVLILREQYYIDLSNPEYNICKIAGNKLGFKHSEATKAKMRISHGVCVKIFDKSNNLVDKFPTKISAARHFNISSTTVGRYLNKNSFYKGFTFKSN